jgi:hypothetical protein
MFFGEKYMIEKITRKIVDSFLFKSNKFLGFSVLNYRFFIYNLLIFIIYILIFLNLFLIILY